MTRQLDRGWMTILAAMLSMFFLGAIYAYGVLLSDIQRAFAWESSTAVVPQSILLFVYAVGMGVGGVLLDRTNPTRVAIAGGAAFGLGVLLASYTHSLLLLVLSYGVLGGIGFGFAYVAAVTAAMKSFPTRRGLAAGLVVGAFGLGSAVWAPIAQRLLPTQGWQGIFFGFGVLTLVVLPLLGLGIRAPRGQVSADHGAVTAGVSLGTALRTPVFWTVFAAYVLVTSAGLLWLNYYKNFGLDQGIPAGQAAFLVVITAIGSGTGRIVMGGLSDRFGRFRSLIAASVLAVVMFTLLMLGLPHLGIFIVAAFIGLAFGTWLALYGPTSTDLFGMKAAGSIYGALYLSYGIGGLIGPTLGGHLVDRSGYRSAFLVAAGCCLLAIVLYALAQRMSVVFYRHPPARDEEIPL